MRLTAKTVVISTSLIAASLSGCSTTTALFGSDREYRNSEGKVVQNLEMPPNLFNPGKAKSNLSLALAQAEQDTLAQQDSYDHIPNFKSNGISIQSNLSERWLEIESDNSEEVWSGLKRFFESVGFTIAEERKDIGVMKTAYLQRSELVPLDDVGPLTRMLNSWRPELAEGVYDKYVARVETDVSGNKTRIYFSHHMLFSPDANEARDLGDRWRIKPYNPVMEAEALYQAMVFFGSTSEKALAQLKITEKMVEIVDGEEFKGLSLRADIDKSWSYIQAMVYRANWQMDKVRIGDHKMWVKVPDSAKKEDSFLSNLAFWKDKGKADLPGIVELQLTPSKIDPAQTILTVENTEGNKPLNAQQRRYVFESLGLLAE
ncbi:outer membrane protein assembly factor BamC [Thiomicrorhabdus arctica]|uniref:outer membrane protein assembly factor BamC n=1 Tax=Thiomicrorhabdus arctica TaxID=131540 RepID=UPI000364E6B6|nr:outer membrane protein assembly factor BamC [Thiomicrorhabdus arctica]